jgi:hypothetical protein
MKRDGNETVAINGVESLAAQRNLPSARSSPAPAEPAAAHNALSNSAIEELLHQALVQGDQDAWAELQQCLGETVRRWLHTHPSKDAAWSFESEEHYVRLAFERFRQAAIEGQVAFETQASALVYLRASLNGTILDSLRAYSRSRAVRYPCQERQAGHTLKIVPRASSCGKSSKRCCPASVSSDWPTCSTTVGWVPERLCGAVKRNGVMPTRPLVYGAAS